MEDIRRDYGERRMICDGYWRVAWSWLAIRCMARRAMSLA